MGSLNPEQEQFSHAAFRSFVLSDRFSCVAAKAALQTGAYRFAYYAKMASADATAELARDLTAFCAEAPSIPSRYTSFIACFGDAFATEVEFEQRLWAQLQGLHDLDASPWDADVSRNPDDPRFAFCFNGTAFYVVGMHARASRRSRRSPFAALVFNGHEQFRKARETGHFERIQKLVRERELRLQGSINPQLRAFGEASEATQYSGRRSENEWRCPFHPRP